MNAGTEPWGINVVKVETKDVDLPDTMKRAMARQAEAERERRAKVIAAEGEYQAAERPLPGGRDDLTRARSAYAADAGRGGHRAQLHAGVSDGRARRGPRVQAGARANGTSGDHSHNDSSLRADGLARNEAAVRHARCERGRRRPRGCFEPVCRKRPAASEPGATQLSPLMPRSPLDRTHHPGGRDTSSARRRVSWSRLVPRSSPRRLPVSGMRWPTSAWRCGARSTGPTTCRRGPQRSRSCRRPARSRT